MPGRASEHGVVLTFARWLMASRLNATLSAAALAVLPLLHVASAGVVGLVALRAGVLEALLIMVGAGALLALLGAVSGLGVLTLVLEIAGLWLVVFLLAALLRRKGSLPLAAEAVTLVAALGAAAFLLLTPDPVAAWRSVLDPMLQPLLVELQAAQTAATAATSTEALLTRLAGMMTGMTGAMAVLLSMLALMLARWWQGLLDNPGGFGRDFRAWRNGRLATIAASLVFLAALLLPGPLVQNLALVALPLLLFQGLAVVHALARLRGLSAGWLVGLYVFMLLPPLALQVMSVLAVLGFVDDVFDFRARFAGLKKGDE